MTTTNAYEALYNNMKTKFTVVSNDCEYTLGSYMSMKANAKANAANLPATRETSQNHSISAIFSYVNDKLAVKEAPKRDKVMKRFPFRTSAAAFLSAIVACALMFSYGIFSNRADSATVPSADATPNIIEEIEETNYTPAS